MKQLTHVQLALVSGGGVILAGEGGGGGSLISIGGNGTSNQAVTIGASITGVAAAIGADAAIGTAGSLGALGVTGAITAASTIGGGFIGAWYIGDTIGTALYNGSDTVQGVAQNMVERFMEGPIDAVTTGVSDIWDMITGQGSYSPPSTGTSPTANSQNTLVVPR